MIKWNNLSVQSCLVVVMSILLCWPCLPVFAGFDAVTRVDGDPVRVVWMNAEARPQAVFWLDDLGQAVSMNVVESSAGQLTIERAGLGVLPKELVLVPTDLSRRPEVVNVTDDQKEVVSPVFQPVAADEMWFWGSGTVRTAFGVSALGPFPFEGRAPGNLWSFTGGAFLKRITQADMAPFKKTISLEYEAHLVDVDIKGLKQIKGIQGMALFQVDPMNWGKSFHVSVHEKPGLDLKDFPL